VRLVAAQCDLAAHVRAVELERVDRGEVGDLEHVALHMQLEPGHERGHPVHVAAAGVAARRPPRHDDRVGGRRAHPGHGRTEPEARMMREALLGRAIREVERHDRRRRR
jgi:hypothetical protein